MSGSNKFSLVCLKSASSGCKRKCSFRKLVIAYIFQPEIVDQKLFLTSAMENKMVVVEKYLTDGGDPNVADHVSVTSVET